MLRKGEKMFPRPLFYSIVFIIFMNFVLTEEQNEPSYLERITSSIGKFGDNLVGGIIGKLGTTDLYEFEVNQQDNKFNYLHEHKFSSPLLLEKCIKFHDSELAWVNATRIDGRWDRHLLSIHLPVSFDYGMAEYDKKEDMIRFEYVPMGYHSVKYVRNDTKMLKSFFVVNELLGIKLSDEEAMIAIDHDAFFFKTACLGVLGRVSVSLHLQLRPEMTDKLESNPELFTQILDGIPEKSLNKISPLIEKLIHENDTRFANFGKDYSKTLTKRLKKWRKVNQLSDKSDDQVFDYLNKTCAHFNEEELVIADLDTITSSNWTLDYTDVNTEKIKFNRMTSKRLSNNTFSVSLFLGKKLLAESDHYSDKNARGFWTYTEGMRSLEVTLYSTHEHRIIYSCEERQIGDELKINEKLRYFSSENKSEPKLTSFESVLNQITENFETKNLNKISQLAKNARPLSLEHNSPHHQEL